MSEYVPTIGLEIHAELKTKTKMFCNSKNDPDETRPNVNICPVCLAHPGTLPVINREAVLHVLRVGVALGSKLADYTEFDRKNYFYPDLPKGYQISQYEYPLVTGGKLNGVAITRVHLEEDTASSIHLSTELKTSDSDRGATVIDFNRAGVPLMELVTEPEIHSVEEAGSFAREFQLLLRYLGVSEANMEKGEMRVEANVSVTHKATPSTAKESPLGTKVEIKNLNSFRAMEHAIAYEIKRQTEILESGKSVGQETRGWNEGMQATFVQRTKEGSADYRYFPDPDLPSLKLSEVPEFSRDVLSTAMSELPWDRRARYITLGVKSDDADQYVRNVRLGDFFDEVTEDAEEGFILLASNYIANDLTKIIRDVEGKDTYLHADIPISVQHFRELIAMIRERRISSRSAKDLLAMVIAEGVSPSLLAEKHQMIQQCDVSALESVVAAVIERNANVIADVRAGKKQGLEFLVGQCMKELRGAGDAVVLRKLLKEKISA